MTPPGMRWGQTHSHRTGCMRKTRRKRFFEQFVTVQSESALRHLANEYPYDDYARAGSPYAVMPTRYAKDSRPSSRPDCKRPGSRCWRPG